TISHNRDHKVLHRMLGRKAIRRYPPPVTTASAATDAATRFPILNIKTAFLSPFSSKHNVRFVIPPPENQRDLSLLAKLF
ncbi:hypothetical protein ACRQFO_09195, partial [Actinotignum sp. GS-2025b]|uniref:hypothetical protein n=1 Tax=Actinotignum sp. GS-2025b TaxID=3427275 RepID=UPI003F44AA5C